MTLRNMLTELLDYDEDIYDLPVRALPDFEPVEGEA